MRNAILMLALLFCVCNTVNMGEELMKREILTKIVEYAQIELPNNLHLLCLPCKLMMKQIQSFHQKFIIFDKKRMGIPLSQIQRSIFL